MKSELLYSTVQGYTPGTTEFAELYDGAFLQMYGRGEGRVTWDGLESEVEWTNYPIRRPDGVYLPDITGLIRFPEGDPVMYRMRGISLLPDQNDRRLFAGPVRWSTSRTEFLWLNDVWGYEEGQLELDSLEFKTRAYVLTAEPIDERAGDHDLG